MQPACSRPATRLQRRPGSCGPTPRSVSMDRAGAAVRQRHHHAGPAVQRPARPAPPRGRSRSAATSPAARSAAAGADQPAPAAQRGDPGRHVGRLPARPGQRARGVSVSARHRAQGPDDHVEVGIAQTRPRSPGRDAHLDQHDGLGGRLPGAARRLDRDSRPDPPAPARRQMTGAVRPWLASGSSPAEWPRTDRSATAGTPRAGQHGQPGAGEHQLVQPPGRHDRGRAADRGGPGQDLGVRRGQHRRHLVLLSPLGVQLAPLQRQRHGQHHDRGPWPPPRTPWPAEGAGPGAARPRAWCRPAASAAGCAPPRPARPP